jgi:hypothetical protein
MIFSFCPTSAALATVRVAVHPASDAGAQCVGKRNVRVGARQAHAARIPLPRGHVSGMADKGIGQSDPELPLHGDYVSVTIP